MSAKSPSLEAELRARIAEAGPMGFDEFMAAALYHPAHGYYAAETSRTGRRGDYFTSVSTGAVFGRLLAAQFAQMWTALGKPGDFTLVEQGANDGQLMDDILAALERDHPAFCPSALIIEPLPSRLAAQQRLLQRWAGRVQWVAREDALPEFTGVFFANELLDAFPVKLLVHREGAWRERRLTVEHDRFAFVETPLSDPAAIRAAAQFPGIAGADPFHAEWCPSLAPWITTIASKLKCGWVFLVDYGHPRHARFHPARAEGSLAAYRGHRRADNPLADPGHQDLTAHVDFTAVAGAAEEAGLHLAGFTDQHHALTALAAEVFPPMPTAALDADAARDMRTLRQLLHPESMGTSFRFLALAKNAHAELSAFRFARSARDELFAA